MAHVNRLALTAMSVVVISDPLKPNRGIQVWPRVCRVECQVVVAVRFDVMHYETTFFFAGTHTSSSLGMYGVKSASLGGSLWLAQLLTHQLNRCK
jgi:hypothetical protein